MTTQRTRSLGRPTLDEVAARAGVGRGTVSRVVNGSPQVSPEARAAVQQAIARAGLRAQPGRPGAGHPADRLGRAGRVRVRGAGLRRAVLRRRSSGASAPCCWRRRCSSGWPWRSRRSERERVEHHLTNQHVDGVLLLSLHDADPLPTLLEERGLPAVLGGRPGPHAATRAPSRPGSSTWTTSAGPGRRWSTCSAQGAATGRHHRRPAGHGRRRGPAGRLPPSAVKATGGRRRPRPDRVRRLQRGQRRRRHASAAGRLPGPGRGLRRLRPDGVRRAAGAARGRPAGARRTSRWSASTTRRSPARPSRR